MFFSFGTPIGNRTLVSAVRGRRLEPLDHEGKLILLCDNIIILHLMQANADMFSQKKCCVRFIRFFAAVYKTPPKNKVIPNKLAIAANIYQKLIFYLLCPL